MGYAHDMHLKIFNDTNRVLRPSSLTLSWGKRYRWDMDAPFTEDKSHEMPTDRNLPAFGPGQPRSDFWLACCGRENASAGTEGDLVLVDERGDKVVRIHFNVPYGLNLDEVRKITYHEEALGWTFRTDGWIGRDYAVTLRYKEPRAAPEMDERQKAEARRKAVEAAERLFE